MDMSLGVANSLILSASIEQRKAGGDALRGCGGSDPPPDAFRRAIEFARAHNKETLVFAIEVVAREHYWAHEERAEEFDRRAGEARAKASGIKDAIRTEDEHDPSGATGEAK